jgi:outer membrane protein OmpA-like peptidoglycan-associated protein
MAQVNGRLISVLGLAALAMTGGTAATAQSDATSRAGVDAYLCKFAGKCAPTDGGAGPSMAAPATKGFRLAAPSGAAHAPATPATTAPAAAVSAARPRAVAAVRPAPRRPVPAGTRADLLLAFGYNSDQLTDASRERAQVFATALMTPELRSKRFLIEGHTDSHGARRLNVDLSRRRAQTVADYLVAQGVERGRVSVKGYGPDRPLPGTPRSAEANRRVEAVLLS